jgi:hypothetical protein
MRTNWQIRLSLKLKTSKRKGFSHSGSEVHALSWSFYSWAVNSTPFLERRTDLTEWNPYRDLYHQIATHLREVGVSPTKDHIRVLANLS